MSKRNGGKKRGRRCKVHRNKYAPPDYAAESAARRERHRNYWSRKWQRTIRGGE